MVLMSKEVDFHLKQIEKQLHRPSNFLRLGTGSQLFRILDYLYEKGLLEGSKIRDWRDAYNSERKCSLELHVRLDIWDHLVRLVPKDLIPKQSRFFKYYSGDLNKKSNETLFSAGVDMIERTGSEIILWSVLSEADFLDRLYLVDPTFLTELKKEISVRFHQMQNPIEDVEE